MYRKSNCKRHTHLGTFIYKSLDILWSPFLLFLP